MHPVDRVGSFMASATPSTPPDDAARVTEDGQSRLALEDEPGHGLDVRPVLQLAWRTLPYLRPVLRELRPLLPVLLLMLVFAVPVTMLGTDLFLTRMLAGEPLTPFQAGLLRLEPATFVDVEQLAAQAQRILRDRLLLILVVLTVVLTPLFAWLIYLVIKIQQRINQILRVEMVERVLAMSLRFHSGQKIGDSLYRTYQDSAMVTSLMSMLVRPIGPLFNIATGLVIGLLFDWRLPLLLLLLYACSYALALRYTPRLRHGFRQARERNSALTSRIQESLAGVRVIKAFGAEALEQERFEEASRAAFDGAFDARARLAGYGIFAFCLSAIPSMLAAAYLAVLAREGTPLLAGVALAFVGFATWNLGAYGDATRRVGSWARSARVLVHMWGRAQDMAVGMQRAFRQVDLDPEVQDVPDAIPLPPFRGTVAFRGVSFRYQSDRPLLEDVDLEARVGTITALVGPTGSGKSTLVSLLLRLFDPDEGRIEIDGLDLRAVQLDSLRSNVSIALQENLLFGTTIRENIRYALEDASDDQVEAAARIACADEFINEHPHGYDTLLGERGAKLSTGQRQRLSIARAIIKDTPILILDEPTAALDAETELRVMRNLSGWGSGRAIFLVTHRLSTIRRADQIVYLRDGRIVEAGTHDELMDREGGAYRRFVELEQESRLSDARPEVD